LGVVSPRDDRGVCARARLSFCRAGAGLAPAKVFVGPAQLPASANSAVVQAECPFPDLGAVCGTVDVPLDREHPELGTIPIFFELFLHSSSGPAESAILVNFGGPGAGTTICCTFFRPVPVPGEPRRA